MRVGVTSDLLTDGGYAFGIEPLASNPRIALVPVRDEGALSADDVAGLDTVVVLRPSVQSQTVAGGSPLHVARVGVGLDTVDVDACTLAGTIVTTTPDGVRRPMASAALAFVLSLAHRLPEKDRHVREGHWDSYDNIGIGLAGRALGLVGLGNVGREVATLVQPFGMAILAADPYAADPPAGVELVDLDELLPRADVVIVCCPLTRETRGLLDRRRIALMPDGSLFVNISRGAVVDQAALTDALRERRIAGAALDVFDPEPLATDDPLRGLDNVIVAPHSAGLTDEMVRRCGESVCASVLAVAEGAVPDHVANPAVLQRDDVRLRLAAFAAAL